jgi:hypothetical protein
VAARCIVALQIPPPPKPISKIEADPRRSEIVVGAQPLRLSLPIPLIFIFNRWIRADYENESITSRVKRDFMHLELVLSQDEDVCTM